MSKLGIRNPFITKIITLIITILFVIIIITLLCLSFFKKDDLYYNLGNINDYNDTLLTSYSEYEKFIIKYDITGSLKETDFSNNYYLASFQEYDKCAERKVKKISEVNINESINIRYLVYNKCGFCKSDVMLYLIPVGKTATFDMEINYSYDYQKELNCGTVALDN